MARGNQRDKAREANLKKQAAIVCPLLIPLPPYFATHLTTDAMR